MRQTCDLTYTWIAQYLDNRVTASLGSRDINLLIQLSVKSESVCREITHNTGEP